MTPTLQDILDADAARRMNDSTPILTEAGRNISADIEIAFPR